MNREFVSASEDLHCLTVRPLPANSYAFVDTETRCRRGSVPGQDGFLSANGAIQGVNQHLNLDELVARALSLIPIKRSGQHLRMRVPVLDCARGPSSAFRVARSFRLPDVSNG
jgi:hypothetical protein